MLCYSVVIEFESQCKTKMNAVTDQRCYRQYISTSAVIYMQTVKCGNRVDCSSVSELRGVVLKQGNIEKMSISVSSIGD